MAFAQTIGTTHYVFPDLKTLLARATPFRSGDALAGVAAESAEERIAAQRALADQMVAYWSRFVATGAPDVEGQPFWPRLDPQRPQRLSLQTSGPVVSADFAERHRCGFWAARG